MKVILPYFLAFFIAAVTIDGHRLNGRRLNDIDAVACNADIPPIDFLVIEGDANAEAIEDEVRTDLEKIGLKVETRFLKKNDYNQARAKGDFGLSFSETWGSPYDPHTYVSAWEASDNANHNALVNLTAPASREELLNMIEDVLTEEDEALRETKWEKVHEYYHQQAVMLPLWGRRIVAIINKKFGGYVRGHQQFDFPVHRLDPHSDDPNITVTISPGALTGRFETVGNLDPHTYNPNEFFANNWVYEGLVSYGESGNILPALATNWTDVDFEGGTKYTFSLRKEVSFHDGAAFNCSAAKMNFDHVLAGELRTPYYHGWYGVPKYIKTWECTDEYTLVLTTSTKFYPFLQELSFIRPLRFMSPNAFYEGSTSDPVTANSCEPGWGTLNEYDGVTVVCKGISAISGTGPFAFTSRKSRVLTTGDFQETRVDDEVVFTRNADYWDGPPKFETLKVVRYESAEEIKAALLDETLDIMWGDGVLSANDVTEIHHIQDSNLEVFYGDDIQNVVLLLNTGTPPLNDINVRKAIIHAINKKALIDKELGGYLDPVDHVFPEEMPYCDVALTPHWDYDSEKAELLSCAEANEADDSSSDDSEALAIGLGVGLGVATLVVIGIAYYYYKRSHDYKIKIEEMKAASVA